jgi:hypothetical protein
VSHGNGTDGRSGGRFGAATPGVRSERAQISDLVAMRVPRQTASRRRVITPWRTTALIAAVLVAAGSYVLGRYVIAPKPPQVVRLAITTTSLAPGAPLTNDDFKMLTVQRSSEPKGALTWVAAKGLIDHFTNRPIPARTFLVREMLTTSGAMPDATHTLVGLALKPGQLPAEGLAVGQRVDVLLLPVNTDGSVIDMTPTSDATVWAMLPPDSSGAREVTVLVRRSAAERLANYASHGQVSLVATGASSQR